MKEYKYSKQDIKDVCDNYEITFNRYMEQVVADIAQIGEPLPCKKLVVGSNPTISSNNRSMFHEES